MIRFLIAFGLVTFSQLALTAEETRSEADAKLLLEGALPGTFRLRGTETSFGLGGRLESHATFSDVYFSAQQSGRDKLRFSQIPVETGVNDQHQFRLNSRESRLWFQLHRPINNQDFNIYVEYDMTKNPDSHQLFLRHAYISFGPIIAGRSFTTFIDSAVLPDVDTGSAPGEIALKRDQIRWTTVLQHNALELSLALEQADSLVSEPNTEQIRHYDDDHTPSLVSRLTRRADWGHIYLATMVRSLRWYQNSQHLSNIAAAVSLSGRIELGFIDNIRFMFNYGNGLGRFLTLGAFADASLASDTSEIYPNTVASMLTAYQHYWNEKWRSTLSLSMSKSRFNGSTSRQLTEQARSLQANLLWSPIPDLSIGVEYLHGQHQLFNGQDGELNRLMFTTRYTLQF
jgi:hypothetical protein